MSTGNESDLEQRALAAVREATRRKAEQNNQAKREANRRQAEQVRALKAFAIGKLEEILDHQTSSADWKITKWAYESCDELQHVLVAYTTVLGVTIKTGQSGGLEVQMPSNRWQGLTLEKFGEALAAWKRSQQPPEPWPPKIPSYGT